MLRLLMCLLVFSLLGCSTISYDPETNKVTYMRLGNQELNGLKVIKAKDGTIEIHLEGQKATDESLQEILRIVRQISGVVTVP